MGRLINVLLTHNGVLFMLINWKRKTAKAALISAVLMSLQACTNLPEGNASVAEAYSSSGSVAVTPYNRTIFSSSNF